MRTTRSRTSLILAGLSTAAVLGTRPPRPTTRAWQRPRSPARTSSSRCATSTAPRRRPRAESTARPRSRPPTAATWSSPPGRRWCRRTPTGSTTSTGATPSRAPPPWSAPPRRAGSATTTASEPSISGGGRFVAFTSFASNLVKDTNGHPRRAGEGHVHRRAPPGLPDQRGQADRPQQLLPGHRRRRPLRRLPDLRQVRAPRPGPPRGRLRARPSPGTTRQVSLTPAGKDVRSGVLVGGSPPTAARSPSATTTAPGCGTSGGADDALLARARRPEPALPRRHRGPPVVSGDGRFRRLLHAQPVRGRRGQGPPVRRVPAEPGDRSLRQGDRVPPGRNANEESGIPSLSHDGRYVGFMSAATNLVAGDIPGVTCSCGTCGGA